jgi:hypothetical protein
METKLFLGLECTNLLFPQDLTRENFWLKKKKNRGVYLCIYDASGLYLRDFVAILVYFCCEAH